jgi:hypothetical protein
VRHGSYQRRRLETQSSLECHKVATILPAEFHVQYSTRTYIGGFARCTWHPRFYRRICALSPDDCWVQRQSLVPLGSKIRLGLSGWCTVLYETNSTRRGQVKNCDSYQGQHVLHPATFSQGARFATSFHKPQTPQTVLPTASLAVSGKSGLCSGLHRNSGRALEDQPPLSGCVFWQRNAV